ncbi:MAG TPA: hypothetical protein VJR48_07570 [Ktedonobacterales bacterium]|nr:hypothetical protein [Ktedonobacterales bacterium]
MAAQFLTTSKLNNIINMISLGRQSGILRVIRGQGPTREIGQIKFSAGEPISALLGQMTGANAMTVLNNWGECIYAFDEQAITDAGEGEIYSSDPGRFSPTSGITSGSWPTYMFPDGAFPQSPSTSYPSGSYPQQNSGSVPPGYTGGYNAPPPNNATSGPGRDTQYNMNRQYTMSGVPVPQVSETISPELMAACPQRTILSEQVEQLPLDRRERMVLLLVDGRRSLSDLARLTRRNEREVLAVLDHMAGLGLIHFNG